jgi:hypothetical protein
LKARGSAILAASLGVALGSVVVEVALRAFPGLLSGPIANATYTAYGMRSYGIYFVDRDSGLPFMKPGFEVDNYWNGYFWKHRTDASGFRNPSDDGAKDVLLLGDSIIYGHGVEEEQTLSHFLRESFGRAAYNMGRQGASLGDYYVLGRLHLASMRPRVVVLFSFINDFHDAELAHSAETLLHPPEIDVDYAALRARVRAWCDGTSRWRRTYDELRLHRFLRAARDVTRPWRHALWTGTSAPAPPPDRGPLYDPVRLARVRAYYERLLPDLDRRCREAGARLLVVHLRMAGDEDVLERSHALVSDVCSRHGIAYRDTVGVFSQESFLPNDGHLTERGHRALAAHVDRLLSDLERTGGTMPLASASPNARTASSPAPRWGTAARQGTRAKRSSTRRLVSRARSRPGSTSFKT